MQKRSHCSFQDFHSLSKGNQVSLLRLHFSHPESDGKSSGTPLREGGPPLKLLVDFSVWFPGDFLVEFLVDFIGPFSLGKQAGKNPPKNPQKIRDSQGNFLTKIY